MERGLPHGRAEGLSAVRDPVAFIRANTRLRPVPHAPEISLFVADEAVPLWSKTEEELERDGLPPPFWAFAWAGGQALARYLLDHAEAVRGKRLLDMGAGSGLVAISAMKSAAASAIGADLDPFAAHAMRLNAEANGVSIQSEAQDLIGAPLEGVDVVTVGDLFYERDLAARLLAWLEGLVGNGVDVLIGDPGRSYLPRDRLSAVAEYQVPVTRDLEDAEIKRSVVWRLEARAAG